MAGRKSAVIKSGLRLVPNVRAAVLAAVLLCMTGLAVPAMAAHHDSAPRELSQFMWGLAGQESGWNYVARNPNSGAFGRYQVMPANWSSWSRRYLGRGWHDQSPLNQELVVRAKVSALYTWLGDWRRVAYWWLSGLTDANRSDWSSMGKRYVRNVMSLMSRAPTQPTTLPEDPAGSTGLPVNVGDWRTTIKPAKIRSVIGYGFQRLGRTARGDTFRVRDAEWNSHHTVVWLRIQTSDGRSGWVNARKTLPASAP
jgi:hypothetical protein